MPPRCAAARSPGGGVPTQNVSAAGPVGSQAYLEALQASVEQSEANIADMKSMTTAFFLVLMGMMVFCECGHDYAAVLADCPARARRSTRPPTPPCPARSGLPCPLSAATALPAQPR